VFTHRDFEVVWAGPAAGPLTRRGVVRYGGAVLPVELRIRDGAYHAVAVTGAGAVPPLLGVALLDRPGAPWSGSLEDLLGRLSVREAEAVHHRASAAVRLAARAALSAALSVDEARLEIVCAPGPVGRRPPEVLLDGSASAADVSLSHHGRWIAWAIRTGVSGPGAVGS